MANVARFLSFLFGQTANSKRYDYSFVGNSDQVALSLFGSLFQACPRLVPGFVPGFRRVILECGATLVSLRNIWGLLGRGFGRES